MYHYWECWPQHIRGTSSIPILVAANILKSIFGNSCLAPKYCDSCHGTKGSSTLLMQYHTHVPCVHSELFGSLWKEACLRLALHQDHGKVVCISHNWRRKIFSPLTTGNATNCPRRGRHVIKKRHKMARREANQRRNSMGKRMTKKSCREAHLYTIQKKVFTTLIDVSYVLHLPLYKEIDLSNTIRHATASQVRPEWRRTIISNKTQCNSMYVASKSM